MVIWTSLNIMDTHVPQGHATWGVSGQLEAEFKAPDPHALLTSQGPQNPPPK